MDGQDKKSGGLISRLVMGIIIGGAIGSVLGLTLAPRKGKETREILAKKGEEFVRDNREKIESAKYQLKRRRGFLRWLFPKKKPQQEMPKASLEEFEKGK